MKKVQNKHLLFFQLYLQALIIFLTHFKAYFRKVQNIKHFHHVFSHIHHVSYEKEVAKKLPTRKSVISVAFTFKIICKLLQCITSSGDQKSYHMIRAYVFMILFPYFMLPVLEDTKQTPIWIVSWFLLCSLWNIFSNYWNIAIFFSK